jgi:hypothetical protein
MKIEIAILSIIMFVALYTCLARVFDEPWWKGITWSISSIAVLIMVWLGAIAFFVI